MKFETHTLNAPFDRYVESIFHFKDFIPDHSIERVVPTGNIFVLFELDGITRSTFNNETLEPESTYTNVWVSGMHKNYISISSHPKSEMLVIQFKPCGAYPFFPIDIENLNEKVIGAEEIFGNEVLKLREHVLLQRTSESKFQVIEKWLGEVFDNSRVPPLDLFNIVGQMQSESIDHYQEIVDNYTKTQKHLINQFKKYVGLTPKYFYRILRFNQILQRIQNKEKISWAQIAYECSYTDQSHFIKDFKHFSGFNPIEFLKNDFHKGEPNFFPLDRHD